MFFKNKIIKIIAEKPDIFGYIPDIFLPRDTIEELCRIPRLVIGEIAAEESIPSIFAMLRKTKADGFLPTIAFTGTEYGNWKCMDKGLILLKKAIEKNLRVYCIDPVILGSPAFWWALNGRFIRELQHRFKFYTPCLGCQLYLHVIRIPLCKKLNVRLMLSGQAEGNTIQQSRLAHYYYNNLLSSFGIELINNTVTKAEIDEAKRLLNWNNVSKNKQRLRCVFEDNNQSINGTSIEPPTMRLFFERFAIPATAKILSRVLAGKTVDYAAEAADTLMPVKKAKEKKHLYKDKQPI